MSMFEPSRRLFSMAERAPAAHLEGGRMSSKRAMLLGLALALAVARANAATVTIDTVGSQADWFVTTDSASVVLAGPSDAYLRSSTVKLNGQDVSGLFQFSGT